MSSGPKAQTRRGGDQNLSRRRERDAGQVPGRLSRGERLAAPAMPKPPTISAQVAGSGTAVTSMKALGWSRWQAEGPHTPARFTSTSPGVELTVVKP